jgi:hypothetical protein
MTGEAIICKMGKHQDIPGADNIVKVELFGETIVTQKTNNEGELGILFDCETQLSHEFCRLNDLFDDTNLNVTYNTKGYISSKNRRVRPITLKGVKVSGFWMPIKSIRFAFDSYAEYQQFCNKAEGSSFNKIGDVEICCKYITPETSRSLTTGAKNKQKSKSKIKDRCPSFIKHFDTSHWGKAHIKFDYPFIATITEKLHGTSLRIGHLKVKQEKSWWQKLLFWKSYPEQYKIVVGTRNTVKTYDLDNCHNNDDLYIRAAREILSYINLQINETIYCEIVGYDNLKPIMPSHSNIKLKGNIPSEEYKKITKSYGDTTTYDYGCSVGEFKVFIYRKTSNGEEIPESWLGKNPPILYKTLIENDEQLEKFKKEVKLYTDGSSKLGKHIKEGVCIRLEQEFDRELEIQVFKNKSFIFKVLEGIAKEDEKYVDQEEIS